MSGSSHVYTVGSSTPWRGTDGNPAGRMRRPLAPAQDQATKGNLKGQALDLVISQQVDRLASVASLTSSLIPAGEQLGDRFFWHSSPNPYVVLVAEFFLRRTNRTTVSRYLPAFLDRFQDAHALACASPEDVVAAASWAGLRVRTGRLPEIARAFLSKPDWSAATLAELPYIGPYAAGAIALYGFGEPGFPIDTNVKRVLSRFLALETEDAIAVQAKRVCDTAFCMGGIEAVQAAHRGALALGWNPCSVVPRCDSCPLSGQCAWREEGTSHGNRL